MGTLLEDILEGLGPEKEGRYCFECGDPGVLQEKTAVSEQFRCPKGHVTPRAYLFDGLARFAVEEGKLVHETAGAVIRRHGKVLLFRRTRFPVGFTIPAGHCELDHDVEAEMRREVKEEVGLDVVNAYPIWADDDAPLLDDQCRRGANLHRWNLFEVEAEGDVVLGEEGFEFGFFSDGEIYDLSTNRLLVPVVREIFERLDVL